MSKEGKTWHRYKREFYDNQSKSHFPGKSGGEVGNYYDEDDRAKKKKNQIYGGSAEKPRGNSLIGARLASGQRAQKERQRISNSSRYL